MERWCRLNDALPSASVEFSEAQIVSRSGDPFHLDSDFIDAAAMRIMQRYEGEPSEVPLELSSDYIASPARTKRYYELYLFDTDGNYTQEFITEASETLALWLEESLGSATYAQAGTAHNAIPGYDLLVLFHDEHETIRLRLVQVKATEADLQGICNKAAVKFGLLEQGKYDPQLFTDLALLSSQRRVPPGTVARELAYDRRYRITAMHAEERGPITLLTTYNRHIPGGIERRSAWFAQVEWTAFWQALSTRIYAQLT